MTRRGPTTSRLKQGRVRAVPLLLLLLALAGCGDDDRIAGGAEDLPGPVPAGVEFTPPPATAFEAPAFDTELVDGTPVRAARLWRARPLVLVFTASYCDRCREIHRVAADTVAAREGAVALLGIVGTDDVEGGREYAEELALGTPLAVAGERVWLSYAAREPGLVVLVARGGKVVRGWPTGARQEELAAALDALIA